jgi:hypothetical protein
MLEDETVHEAHAAPTSQEKFIRFRSKRGQYNTITFSSVGASEHHA